MAVVGALHRRVSERRRSNGALNTTPGIAHTHIRIRGASRLGGGGVGGGMSPSRCKLLFCQSVQREANELALSIERTYTRSET